MPAYLLLHVRASSRVKPDLLYVNNKGTDQPSHLRSLFNSFLIHYLESMIATYRCTLQMYIVTQAHSSFSSLVQSLLPKDTLLRALHYSVDFIFLPFGIKGFIVEL